MLLLYDWIVGCGVEGLVIWFGFVDYTGLLCGVGFGGCCFGDCCVCLLCLLGFAFWSVLWV